ncbi:Transposable element Hobo transposase [Frankliniella fusca]|uniref:Transposable element Hobo transposase n=1 Tax=Frankliniella fusca TaxID=407009 RepID=A0AAE1LPP9_9NEOP|nr:Transposable element Hobo transposase [Frankliniella fusca]
MSAPAPRTRSRRRKAPQVTVPLPGPGEGDDPPPLGKVLEPENRREGAAAAGVSVQPPLSSPTPSTSSESSSSNSCPGDLLVEESVRKLRAGEYYTSPQKKASHTSNAWKTFHVVKERGTDLEVGTAMCIVCECVLSCKSGTSSMLKHQLSYCTGMVNGPGAGAQYRPVPTVLRGTFVDKLADTCALTMGSVHLLTSPAVVGLIQTAVDISARCRGRVDVQDLMPHATTVMSRIDTRADMEMKRLVPRVKKAIAEHKCQGSTDMWTDDDQKRHFIAITVTFVDDEKEECVAETYDLVVAKFPSAMKATGVNIRNAMFTAMAELGFTAEEFSGIEWVTDRGANIKKALENDSR